MWMRSNVQQTAHTKYNSNRSFEYVYVSFVGCQPHIVQAEEGWIRRVVGSVKAITMAYCYLLLFTQLMILHVLSLPQFHLCVCVEARFGTLIVMFVIYFFVCFAFVVLIPTPQLGISIFTIQLVRHTKFMFFCQRHISLVSSLSAIPSNYIHRLETIRIRSMLKITRFNSSCFMTVPLQNTNVVFQSFIPWFGFLFIKNENEKNHFAWIFACYFHVLWWFLLGHVYVSQLQPETKTEKNKSKSTDKNNNFMKSIDPLWNELIYWYIAPFSCP